MDSLTTTRFGPRRLTSRLRETNRQTCRRGNRQRSRLGSKKTVDGSIFLIRCITNKNSLYIYLLIGVDGSLTAVLTARLTVGLLRPHFHAPQVIRKPAVKPSNGGWKAHREVRR